MSIFNVAVSGLNAAQVGIQTTSHNISNASTAGYNRQQIIQTTNIPMFTGAGFIGQGTSVETVRRVYSQQLSEQVRSASTGAAEMDSYLSQISQIDNLLADPDAGLSPALSSFFAAVQEMAAYPASLPARQAMLSSSQALVSRFQAIDERMTEIRSGVNAQITSEVTAINSYAQQIAEINQRIVLAQAAGPNQPANDLLDQRDQLIADLNTKIRATTITQSDGTYSVFIGNGQPLVIGTLSFSMQAMAAPDDPERMIVALRSPNGNPPILMPESMLTGGSLGGLIAFRSDSLDAAQNALGRIALTLATDVNAQHRLGQDLTGALGGDYFVAASSLVRQPQANSTNAGTGVLSLAVTTVPDLTTSDYRLTYDGANYSLLRLSDNTAIPYTLGTEVDGITLTLSGAPSAGDSFLIQPTRMGAANLALAITDPRAIAAATPIRTGTALTNTGTASIDAGSISSIASLPLTGTVTLTYDSGTNQFVVTGPIAAGPFAYTTGTPINFAGMSVTITGAPANGDSFTIVNNTSGVSDNRNAVLLGALQTKNTMEGDSANGVAPTATYQSAYSTLVAQVGNKTREVEITGKAQQSLFEQAEATRSQLSGVNLDEEAANLLRYQQAYQAAAKVISIAGTLFDEILALSR